MDVEEQAPLYRERWLIFPKTSRALDEAIYRHLKEAKVLADGVNRG